MAQVLDFFYFFSKSFSYEVTLRVKKQIAVSMVNAFVDILDISKEESNASLLKCIMVVIML